MIFSITCILEQLRKNIICVPGDRNIKNPLSDGDIQARLHVCPWARQANSSLMLECTPPGDGDHWSRSQGAPIPSTAANEAPLVPDGVARAHWLPVKDCQIELLVITAGKLFSQYF